MTVNFTKPQLSPDELTLHLVASGIVKLAESLKNGKAPTLPYPKELQRGLDRLVLNCLRQGRKPPQGVPELLCWCRRPLTEWHLDLSQEDLGVADKLLDGQIPTAICEEWAIASSDIEAELTQKQLLLNVMSVCRLADTPDSYVQFRRLLISQLLLTAFELLQICTEPLLEKLEEQIQAAYEPAPESYAVDGYFHCCAHCGNLMLRTVQGELICAEDRCRAKNVSKSGRQISQKQQVIWLKRGLRRFIAAPGCAELRLAEKLENLGKSRLQVNLWPDFDAYDLRIVFPDNEVWAIDVKDWANPFLLAHKVRQQNPLIPSKPPWIKAYFVFPDDRSEQRPDYLRAFCNHCPLPKQIKAKFESAFIKDVRNKLQRC
ncbi:hypothetical protein I8748_34225 [Nostoc sp. CENA67]|uniref:REase associating with pPIWI RE domain-containing protein n=1 Tax=Amazonocrinis nigriterrae CENA67 TaxID=2794033 RepID=A0A8J7I2W9_9NOST|nr:hypothetical protein [Amazonocrinis nigriterrae]MBH8567149.1 hypothetical protein [Amazonocrinis nigriterrae CENA67]